MAVPPDWFAAAAIVAVVLGAGHLLSPSGRRERLAFALGTLATIPLLLVAGMILFDVAEGAGEPWSGVGAWFLLLLPAILLGAVLSPLRQRHFDALSRRAKATLLAVTIVLGLLATPASLIALTVGGPDLAEQEWRLSIAPNGTDPYRLRVPFFEAGDPDAAVLRGGLGEHLLVERGDVAFSFEQNGTWLVLEGRGQAALSSRYAYYGSIGLREAFHDLRFPSRSVVLEPRDSSVTVTLTLDFSGGTGHTCWLSNVLAATVPPGASSRLTSRDHEAFEREETSADAAEGALGQGVCA